MKKTIGFTFAFVMLFIFAACNQVFFSKYSELAKYKSISKAEIEAYANFNGQEHYKEDDWLSICELVNTGKETINVAKNEQEVETAFIRTKEKIDSVKTIFDFDGGTLNRIKQDFVKKRYNEGVVDYMPENFSITEYYGIYSGCVIMMMGRSLLPMGRDEIIANVIFYFSMSDKIHAWKDGVFYGLKEAYEKGLLTDENMIEIVHEYKAYHPSAYKAQYGDVVEIFAGATRNFKETYELNEELCLDGLIIKCAMTDGSLVALNHEQYTIDASEYNKDETGIYFIYIFYGDLETCFWLNVAKLSEDEFISGMRFYVDID